MKYLLALLLYSLLLFSCKKDKTTGSPDQQTNNNTPALSLLSPANESELYPSNVQFNWTDCGSSSYRLIISHNSDYSIPWTDTTNDTVGYFFKGYLKSDKTIYWRVIADNDTADGKFYTKNYATLFEGTYPVSVHYHSYGSAPYVDSTYNDVVTIVKQTDRILVSMPSFPNTINMGFWSGEADGSAVTFSNMPTSAGTACFSTRGIQNGSLSVSFKSGGLSGGYYWDCIKL